jgi:hypothetical protein
MRKIIVLALSLLVSATLAAQQTRKSPQSSRAQGVVTIGEHVMGFSHEATTHHFRLFRNGGEIDVSANTSTDKTNIDQIRMHLRHIAKMFASGNFNAPMIIHVTNPPGVATMTKLKEQIRYEYSETDRGARIRIITPSPETTDAVDAFLLFQIVDHKTGDAPNISDDILNP